MDTSITIRTDKETRRKAKKVFADLGLTTSAGINMFLRQVVTHKGLPFTPTIDKKKIAAEWDKEVEEALKHGRRFTSAKEMHAWIETLAQGNEAL